MKYKEGNFLELSRNIFKEKYKRLSINAKWLYVVLVELEHRFTGKGVDFFTRSNSQLADDTGMSLATLKRAKKELEATHLIQTWQCHFKYSDTGKLSKQHYTAYRIRN